MVFWLCSAVFFILAFGFWGLVLFLVQIFKCRFWLLVVSFSGVSGSFGFPVPKRASPPLVIPVMW